MAVVMQGRANSYSFTIATCAKESGNSGGSTIVTAAFLRCLDEVIYANVGFGAVRSKIAVTAISLKVPHP